VTVDQLKEMFGDEYISAVLVDGIRLAAAEALNRIDPEAAARAGVK
jgi:hypothetical protein